MTHRVLSNCLKPIIKAETRWRKRIVFTAGLLAGSLGMLILAVVAARADWWSTPLAILVSLGSLLLIGLGLWRIAASRPDLKKLARQVEEQHPDLNAALLTALEMRPNPDGRLSYLQSQVLRQVTEHALRNRWVRQVSTSKLEKAGWGQLAALLLFLASAWILVGQYPGLRTGGETVAEKALKEHPGAGRIELTVSPGDVEVEKGSRVVVEASFTGRVPDAAIVVLSDPGDGSEIGRLPMRAGLDDSVFSTIIAEVDTEMKYTVHYEESGTDPFLIQVYEHPRLEQADATITPPAYTGEEPRTMEDTRKISLLEGGRVDWAIRVNKPVAMAELFGEDETVIELKPVADDPTLLAASHVPEKTQRYRLHLIDGKDRANKRPPWLSVKVKRNLPPKLEFSFPGRDVDVSAIQEFAVEARVWDDVGLKGAGIVFQHAETEKEIVLTDGDLPGDAKHDLRALLEVEELGANPRELISYHLWAEDMDREGKLRRTRSDQFYAEVRHFEDIFREQSAPGGQGQQGQQGQSEELLKLQKEILNASWKTLRKAHLGKTHAELNDDISVIRESQEIAIQKTEAAIQEVEDPELKSFFNEAKGHMQQMVDHLTIKVTDPFQDMEKPPLEPLELAHASAKNAYESLIKARSREHNVTQSQSMSQGQQSQQERQQLSNLELKQKELKYQENRSAQPEQQTQEQQENLEVLNKLKELARRQEAIAEKIKELRNELEEAETEEEKERIERQLKRLQEEQEELLRELDELSERMDSEENRADMAEERKKLEDVRENVREAAEELKNQELADAANSATRAQRELEEVEDEFRKRTSRQFSDEMKNIRETARDLAENQKQISERLDEKAPEGTDTGNYFRTPEENLDLARDLENQRKAMQELIEEMKQISEDAEESEPLLSDALYEAVRENIVNGVDESLSEARDMVRYNRRSRAREPEQNAAQGIEELKEKVEKAAEKILGSEADSLRLARAELDRLIEQSRSEVERLEGERGEQPEGGQPRPGAGENPDREEDGKAGREEPKGEGGGKAKAGEDSPKGSGEKGEKGEKGDRPGGGKGEGEKGSPKGEGEGESDEGKGEGKGKGKGQGKGQGKGDRPGNGRQPGEGDPTQLAQEDQAGKGGKAGPGKGEGEGEGEGKGDEDSRGDKGKGKGEGKGQGQGQGKGESRMAGNEPGSERGGDPESDRPRRPSLLTQRSQQDGGRRSAGSNFGGDDRGSRMPTGLASGPPKFFERAEEETQPAGPITGEDYKEFANSLGNIEEMMNQEDLRNEIAKVLDNARGMRVDFKRDNLPPGAASIQKKIVDPLVEIRSRVSEELAKLNKENPLAPIDRDPVPGEFRDLVRKYYEELGAGR